MTHAAQKSKPKRTKQTGSAPTVSPTPSPIPTSTIVESSDWFAPQTGTSKFAAKAEAASTLTQDELIEREAIRNLWPLLNGPARAAHKDLVDPPKGARLSRTAAEMRRLMDERPEEYR